MKKSIGLTYLSLAQIDMHLRDYPETKNRTYLSKECILNRQSFDGLREMADLQRWLLFSCPFMLDGIGSRFIEPDIVSMTYGEYIGIVPKYLDLLAKYRITKLQDGDGTPDLELTYLNRKVYFELTQQATEFNHNEQSFSIARNKELVLDTFDSIKKKLEKNTPYKGSPELVSIMNLQSQGAGVLNHDLRDQLQSYGLGPFSAINIFYQGDLKTNIDDSTKTFSANLLRKDEFGVYQCQITDVPEKYI